MATAFDIAPAAPAKPRDTARQRLWAAMRTLRHFDRVELLMWADASEKAATALIYDLTRAGYLTIVDYGTRSIGKPMRWKLVRDTGRLAPRASTVRHDGRPTRILKDPNTGTRTPILSRERRLEAAFAEAEGGEG